MISKTYLDMLGQKSVIREIAEFGARRAEVIGRENVFDYSIGNPSVPVPPAFNEELVRLVQTTDPVLLHGYSPTLGIEEVREKLAASLSRRFGVPYQGRHIFMAAGACGALAHALRAAAQPGDEVITFAPFFPEYTPYVAATGAKLKIVPPDVETFQINFEKFEELLNPKVAAVLINTPNNPSGVVYSTSTIERLAALLTKKEAEFGHEIYLISDEPYREILFAGTDAPYTASFYPNTLTCYSFSKSLSIPGERIGYVAVNPACKHADILVDIFGQISRGIGHNCPSSLMQLAVAALADTTAELHIYETNKTLLYEALLSLGFSCVEPKGTFYMFPRALEADANAFCKKAMELDLLLVPGDSFGCPGHFRIAYCVETEKLKRSLPVFEKLAKLY